MYVEGMLTPSLIQIGRDFGLNPKDAPAELSLILALYAVSGTALNPVVGKLGDIYGKKRVLTYVLLIYAVAVTLTGFAPTFELMLVSRTVQGVGLAIFPLVFSLVREEFPRDMVPRAQGIISGMFGVGFAVSIPLGAYVSETWGWRFTYHTAVPFVIIGAALIIILVKESAFTRPHERVDFVGASLLGISLVALVLALAQGSAWGWTSPMTLGLVAVSVALLFPLYAYERNYSRGGSEPILNLRLLSIRNVVISNIVILVASLGMFLAFQAYLYKFGPQFPSPVGFGLDIFHIGLSLFPLAASFIIFAPLTGILVPRTGVKRISLLGGVVGAVGFFLSMFSTTYVQYLLSMFVAGAGLAVLQASVINLLTLSIETRDMGLATSMNTVFRNLGSSVGAPIAGSLLSTFAPGSAFQYIFLIAVAAFILVILVVPYGVEVLGRTQFKRTVSTSRPARQN